MTFPRAYHTGFSHGKILHIHTSQSANGTTALNILSLSLSVSGEMMIVLPVSKIIWMCFVGFNCGEAANIATPEWLRFAKDAAIRRASINYPPMVSHFQLLYDLGLALCSRFVFPNYLLELIQIP